MARLDGDPRWGPESGGTLAIARRFVEARQSASVLPEFPGRLPRTLDEGYACQEAAISLWTDEIAGWKVGRVPQEWEASVGERRQAGPIFRREVREAGDGPVAFPVFVGGFAAVEAEFVWRAGEDAPPSKTHWTDEAAAALAGSLHIAVETAGSPLATINALGPTAVVSDFGNNAGLILGPEIPDWRDLPPRSLTCETFIDGRSVGRGAAAAILDGPLGSLRFILEHCARRGRPLKRGQLVSTGAATGVHDIVAGQVARVDFGDYGVIECVAQPAQARSG